MNYSYGIEHNATNAVNRAQLVKPVKFRTCQTHCDFVVLSRVTPRVTRAERDGETLVLMF